MVTVVVMALSLVSFVTFQIVMRPTPIRVHVLADDPVGGSVPPVWTRLNIWDLSMAPTEQPAPFIREVILMTATGGRVTSEMFNTTPDGAASHDFTKLDTALDRVLQAGLHPTIVLGNTPEALSDSPVDKGAFDANVGAPTDYDLYYEYIRSLFSHVCDRYGRETVESWNFRLMTEPDNTDWWNSGLPEYQRLYDFTVAAARSEAPGVVIDLGNLMTPVGEGAWSSKLAEWFATDLSAPVENALPRRTRRLGFSCYSRGQIGMDPRELGEIANELETSLQQLGDALPTVDEGMILHDEEGKRLWLGDGSELGAAWNAAIFKICIDHGIERYVQWGFQTDGVKSPSYNVAMMYERLLGGDQLKVRVGGGRTSSDTYVDAIASMGKDGSVRIIAFHYRPDRFPAPDEKIRIKVGGLPDGEYAVEHWRVDRDHSNFFTKWLEDSKGLVRIDTGSGSGSIWDLAATSVLTRKGWELWHSKRPEYLEIDDLQRYEESSQVTVRGEFAKDIVLPPNSVSLIELVKI